MCPRTTRMAYARYVVRTTKELGAWWASGAGLSSVRGGDCTDGTVDGASGVALESVVGTVRRLRRAADEDRPLTMAAGADRLTSTNARP